MTSVKIIPKILFQKTRDRDLKYDDNVGAYIANKFQHWIDSLGFLSSLAVPCYLSKDSFQQVDLHLFCDASEMTHGVPEQLQNLHFLVSRQITTCIKEDSLYSKT